MCLARTVAGLVGHHSDTVTQLEQLLNNVADLPRAEAQAALREAASGALPAPALAVNLAWALLRSGLAQEGLGVCERLTGAQPQFAAGGARRSEWALATGQPDLGGEIPRPEHVLRTLFAGIGLTEDVTDMRVEPITAMMKS